MYTFSIQSGSQVVEFSVDASQAVTTQVAQGLRKHFQIPVDAKLPTLVYQDDEGDSIRLDPQVSAELEEALRVLGTSLRFELLTPVALRRRTQPAAGNAAHHAAVGEDNDSLSDCLAQVQKVMHTFKTKADSREATLRQELSDFEQQLEDLRGDLGRTVGDLQTQTRTASEYQQKAAALEHLVLQKTNDLAATSAELDKANTTISDLRSQAEQLENTNISQKQALMGEIAARDNVIDATKREVQALSAKNEDLQQKLDEVHQTLKTLLPSTAAPKKASRSRFLDKFVRGVGDVTNAIEAVCVAGKEEITEAVQKTHNYAAAAAHSSPAGDVESAAQTLSEMGFELTLPEVRALMKMHKGDVARVVEAVCCAKTK